MGTMLVQIEVMAGIHRNMMKQNIVLNVGQKGTKEHLMEVDK